MLTFSSMLAVSQMNGLRTFSRRKRTRTSLQSNLMDEMKDSKKAEEVKEGMQPEKEDEDEGDGHHHEKRRGSRV